uniref:ammonia-forming cytochrome c nitrite reductase subunit c552 n=1 Tax=Vaginimicrobium propionicum TaxID=1871034 RepID=UPI000970464B|nr:ammonia-forming cytochrome c nitrite reductase subunit c552 [Vaginimicrobium propionicum]
MSDEVPKRVSDQGATTWTGPRKRWVPIVVLIVVAIAAAALTWLLTTIFQHKVEAKAPFTQVVEITEQTYDPAQWGLNYPLQYEGFKNTAIMDPENKRANTDPSVPEDTREYIANSKLAWEPRLVTIWKGYAFSVEYNEPRGHEYMLEDQKYIRRQTDFKQPGACLNCHVSLPQVVDDLGNGDRDAGWAAMNKMDYRDAVQHAGGPIGCIDCHEPGTMKLRVTRPALIDGLKRLKASEGITDYDVNRDATTQEMRAYVCAQCHVEYYFKGEDKTLTFPWTYGTTVNDAIKYYDEEGFSDFQHADTKANVIKAQHPDFETWSQGIHADNGVTCADCHMAYQRDGAAKVSNHQVRSPILDEASINASCLTCHHDTAAGMKQRVTDIQTNFLAAKDVAFTAVQSLIDEISSAVADGSATQEQLDKAYEFQRKAQFIVDYSVSENSRGFHAPQYSMQILNEATDYARSGQLALRGVDVENARPADSYDIKPVERPGAK